MKYCSLIAIFSLLLASCGGVEPQHTENLPDACGLLTVDQLKDILLEPVERPVPTKANFGEKSACSYSLPGRGSDDILVIYILESKTGKDPDKFDALVAEWQARNMGAEYEEETVSGYPMAFFEGEHHVNPSTFLISFNQVDLAIQGASKENAKSIAFRAMVQYQWK